MSLASLASSAVSSLLGSPSASAPAVGANASSIALSWQDSGGAPHSLSFDVISNETWTLLAEVTEHNVERGSAVADHIRLKNEVVELIGFVSNSPLSSNFQSGFSLATVPLKVAKVDPKLSLSSAVSAGVSALSSAVGLSPDPAPSATVYTNPNYSDRVRIYFEQLQQIRSDASLIRLVSRLGILDNMVLTKLSVPREVASGTGAVFQLELKRIRFVTALSVAAPPEAPAELRGQVQQAKGSRAAQQASEAQRSAALQIAQGISGNAKILQ